MKPCSESFGLIFTSLEKIRRWLEKNTETEEAQGLLMDIEYDTRLAARRITGVEG